MNKVETLIAERKSTVEQELQALIVKCNMLKRERDEARRELCDEIRWARGGVMSVELIARERGWDCFKENTDD